MRRGVRSPWKSWCARDFERTNDAANNRRQRRRETTRVRALPRLPACPDHQIRPDFNFPSVPAFIHRSAVCKIPASAGSHLPRLFEAGIQRVGRNFVTGRDCFSTQFSIRPTPGIPERWVRWISSYPRRCRRKSLCLRAKRPRGPPVFQPVACRG